MEQYMPELSYGTLEFPISGWYDQVQIGYVENDGRLEDYQDRPGFKLFGYTFDGVLVDCVCVRYEEDNENRSQGSIYFDQKGAEELFAPFLPLPKAQFDWLWATLARCQDCLSRIEVAVSYATEESTSDSNSQNMSISGASFTLCTGDYFKDR
jgi:hypothetical protein